MFLRVVLVLLLVALIPLGVVVHYFPWFVPSRGFGIDSSTVSEWLSWIGLIAFIFSLWQLLKTSSAASAAQTAVADFVKKMESFDVSLDLKNAVIVCEQAANQIPSDVKAAKKSCATLLDLLAAIEPHHKRLAAEITDRLMAVKEQIGSVSGACARGMQSSLTPAELIALEDTLGDQKRELIVVSGLVRTSGSVIAHD